MATPASSINALRKDLLRIATKRCAHVSPTTAISAPNATDNSTRVLCRLLNELKSAVNAHMASSLGSEVAEEVEA